MVETIDTLDSGLADNRELLELAVMEEDDATVDEVRKELVYLEGQLDKLEFRRMFAGEMDENNAYLDIQAGSGGTEAQDWANMLLRMYLRWAEHHGFKAELTEVSAGEVAGIKSATVHVQGDYAFGWLRTETGVHRLVRKSPFDSGGRRHTSFASVFLSPRSMTTSRWRSTRPTCASTPIAPPGPAVSTSTPPTRRCVSPTSPPVSWWRARASVASTPTATSP